jgi:hypothetical protein
MRNTFKIVAGIPARIKVVARPRLRWKKHKKLDRK